MTAPALSPALAMTKRIPLTRGQFAIVDDADYEALAGHNWYLTSYGYARRAVKVDGKWTSVFMHRLIAGAPPDQQVDHRDGDRLNNTRANLRTCDRWQNCQNSRARRGSKSGLKGVVPRNGRWVAHIRANRCSRYLGTFDTAEQAHEAYKAAALEMAGEFACAAPPLPTAELEPAADLYGARLPRLPVSGFRGVKQEKSGRWSASISVKRKKRYLGTFDSREEAHAAYQAAVQHVPASRAPKGDDGSQEALEILCRVFDDGADVAYQEWLAWYDPAQWFNWSRALGAFIRRRLVAAGWRAPEGETGG